MCTKRKSFNKSLKCLQFLKDIEENPPKMCIWQHLSKDDMIEINSLGETEEIIDFLEVKFTPMRPGLSVHFFCELILEVLRFARLNKFCDKKISTLISIYYKTHDFVTSQLKSSIKKTYIYFKECCLLHTVQHPPKSIELYDPKESRLILLHFCDTYLRYMPEIQILATKQYKINIDWIPIVVANVDYVVEAAMNEAARRQQGIMNVSKPKSKMKHI